MANGHMLQILQPVSQLTGTLSSGPRRQSIPMMQHRATYCNSANPLVEGEKENRVKPSEWKPIRYSDDDSVIVTFGFPLQQTQKELRHASMWALRTVDTTRTADVKLMWEENQKVAFYICWQRKIYLPSTCVQQKLISVRCVYLTSNFILFVV